MRINGGCEWQSAILYKRRYRVQQPAPGNGEWHRVKGLLFGVTGCTPGKEARLSNIILPFYTRRLYADVEPYRSAVLRCRYEPCGRTWFGHVKKCPGGYCADDRV